ncbi:hypothetical protein [Streptomyces sp. TLI_171]|uniref:hypothetical protein n=1 Tax=Streptomyces sp. TLI_171 TaxID=1938859 RepID=UPI000C17BE99|nr:hypothetical protein [Streptomyces sp. TLI_171]RKE22607.1 hypothetical protein BX266_6054 [Streptomyces sp. TLI_171]
MDVAELLEAAALLVPEGAATADDLTLADVWEWLAHDQWEVAIGVLEELGDRPALPLAFWENLAEVAEQLHLERSTRWCRWRCYEARNGVIRAELTLRPAGESRRTGPFSGAGVMRPMWNIGHRTPDGDTVVDIAALWVEATPFLGPGERATVRLAPLDPQRWRGLRPGQLIAMHEDRTVGGTAVILEVSAPAAGPGAG